MAETNDWFVQIPVNQNNLAAWKSNHEAHVAHLKPYIMDGTLAFGGPTLESHLKSPGDEIKAQGSVLVFRAGTEQDVRNIIEQNAFVEAGVWDMSQAVVTPFLWIVGKPAA